MSDGMNHCAALERQKNVNLPASSDDPPQLTWMQLADLRHRAERLQIYLMNGACSAREIVEEIDKITLGVKDGNT